MPQPGEAGFAQETLHRIRQLRDLPRQEGAPPPKINIIEDFAARTFVVTAEFPIERIEDSQSGELTIRAIDYLKSEEKA